MRKTEHPKGRKIATFLHTFLCGCDPFARNFKKVRLAFGCNKSESDAMEVERPKAGKSTIFPQKNAQIFPWLIQLRLTSKKFVAHFFYCFFVNKFLPNLLRPGGDGERCGREGGWAPMIRKVEESQNAATFEAGLARIASFLL